MKLEGYRKAIAAMVAGLLGLVGHFVPAVSGVLSPEAINMASVTAAALAAYWFENRADGYNVATLAKALADAIRDGDEAAAHPAPPRPARVPR